MERIDELLAAIATNYPESSLRPVEEKWLASAEAKFPGMPEDLKQLYEKLGCGCIGDSCYMVHVFLHPSDIYDKATAEALDGVLIVGDDFAGQCEAYDAKNGWRFGSIGGNGRFEEYGGKIGSFLDFLMDWYGPDAEE